MVKLYGKGVECYPKEGVLLNNVVFFAWVALGAVACSFFAPWLAAAYLAFAIIMVGFALRKLLCTKCYYYGKWCGMGWGAWTARLFKKGDIKKFNEGLGRKLAPATYGLLLIVPLLASAWTLYASFSLQKLGVLVAFLSVAGYSLAGRPAGCAKCKMRYYCRGSAAK